MLEEFRKHFEYRDGRLYWKVGRRGTKGKGTLVGGGVSRHGYKRMMFMGKEYNIARVVFFIHHGYWPKIVDHINGNKLDDRIENLREADEFQNQHNVGPNSRNTTGYKGVQRRGDRFVARIMSRHKLYHIGTYDTAEEAAEAYDQKAIELNGEYARLNFERKDV